MKISLNLLIYNESMDIIRRCLNSVDDLVDEIVVYVDHRWSANALVDEYDITLIKSINLDGSVVEQYRNLMIEDSLYEWILILDPDEYLDDEARVFVRELRKQSSPIENRFAGFVFPRKNYEYNQKREVLYLGNYPDRQMRLLRSHIRYHGAIHMPPVIPKGLLLLLARGHIIHDKRHETYEEWYRKLILYRSKGAHDDVEL